MEITYKDVIAAVRNIVASRPNVTYESTVYCYYNRGKCSDGSVGCIFGQAFRALGVPEEELIELDKSPPNASTAAYKLFHKGSSPDDQDLIPSDVQAWMDKAQANQDSGQSWSEALSSADDLWSFE